MAKQTQKKKKPLARKVFSLVVFLMPCVMVLSLVFFYFQFRQLQSGILDVCATQQDSYVELVLSQINLKENRDNAEIITNILGTLDSSSNKYWTFSSQQTMLFVKDVFETNRYRGFTASTYYSSESASAFFQSLQLNRVTHTNIIIDDKEYVASGVAFEYQGRPYKLCLLTNSDVLLDNNYFLGAASQTWTLIFLLVGALTILPMAIAILLRKVQLKEERSEEVIAGMNDKLIEMNGRLSRKGLYNTRASVWSDETLPRFLQGLRKKEVSTVTMMRLHCARIDERDRFLSMSHYTLDQRVLRFETGETDLILLFLEIDRDTATLSVIPLLSLETVIVKTLSVGDPGIPTPETAARILLRTDTAAPAGR